MVDGSIPIVLALVGTPVVCPGLRHLKTRDRVQREIPKPNALAVVGHNGGAHKSEYVKVDNAWRSLASRTRCTQAGLLAQEPVDIVGLVEIPGERQVRLAQQMPKIIVAVG